MAQVFCKNLKSVENYEIAKKENFRKWQIHHRLETHNSDGEKRIVQITKAELVALDMYYNRPAEELIYLRLAEHTQIHSKGHKVFESQKVKTSMALKGHKVTEETRNKISQKLKGCKISEETKLKISLKLKGGNKTSFQKGHKNTEEQIKKQIKTAKKSMQIRVELYKAKYKDIMTWNEFQNFYKQYKKSVDIILK